MEDQGIMALPNGQAMRGEGAMPTPKVTPEAQTAFESARMQIDPFEFQDELLMQAEKADPETVAEFRRVLEESNLPLEVIDALGQMVDTVLAEPEKYDEIRSRFIQEGVPEDFLPQQFDAAFFGALNMALDQLNMNLEPTPAAFAKGGEVKMSPVASGIAQLGRKGDSQLAHITMSEARMLRRRGGSGTINPSTGLPEYFIDKVFKSVGKALKSVGKAVSSAVKGVVNGVKKFAKSTVGRIVTTIALGFFLGPAAASLMGVGAGSVVGTAISGFVGGFGSSLLAGDNVKTALRNGAIGGITAGAMSGISGSAFTTPSTMTAGEAITSQWDKFTKGIGSLTGGAPAETAAAPTSDVTAAAQETALPKPIEPPQFTAAAEPGTQVAGQARGIGPVSGAPVQQTPTDFMRSIEPRTFGQTAPQLTTPATTPFEQAFQTQAFEQAAGIGQTQPFATAPSNVAIERSMLGMTGPIDTARQFMSAPVETGADIFNRNVMPGGIEEAGKTNAMRAAQNARIEALNSGFSQATAEKMALDAYNKALPGAFAKYGPMVALGTGILGAAGGFKQEPATPPGIIPKETGEDLLKKYPERYGVTPGGGQIFYGGYGGRKFASGGIAELKEKYPRMNGPINGPGTGTSDSIPAMLSDGEFVFTAKAVRAMGNGSRRKGAKRMYALMKKLEGRK